MNVKITKQIETLMFFIPIKDENGEGKKKNKMGNLAGNKICLNIEDTQDSKIDREYAWDENHTWSGVAVALWLSVET